MSLIIGIDPGLSGAVGVLDHNGTTAVFDMPVADRSVSGRLLWLALKDRHIALAVVEKVGSMPGQGVASTFRFGRAAGVVDGVLGALGVPTQYVSPAVWKRHFGLLKKPKDASRLIALERFPHCADELKRKKDHGRAEALLIALWGRSLLMKTGGKR